MGPGLKSCIGLHILSQSKRMKKWRRVARNINLISKRLNELHNTRSFSQSRRKKIYWVGYWRGNANVPPNIESNQIYFLEVKNEPLRIMTKEQKLQIDVPYTVIKRRVRRHTHRVKEKEIIGSLCKYFALLWMVSCGDAKKKGAVRGRYRTAGQEGIISHPDSMCRDIKSYLHQQHNGEGRVCLSMGFVCESTERYLSEVRVTRM